ncbi:MAG: HAMP domain-containing sensor histidine kinase [Halobacteriales archaeon]|nr:HAMP domain-containing sensor histidine kinase [Halobacteriales archaeon]
MATDDHSPKVPTTVETRQVNYGGLVIAAVGFLLTRYTVLDVLQTEGQNAPAIPGLAVVPLVFGLGLVVFGIGLSVSTFRRRYVNTVARWCLAGTIGMVIIVLTALFDSVVLGGLSLYMLTTDPLITNVLIGGAVGGVLIGLRSAENGEQRRMLARRSDQAIVLNRLLRHEVLNAITIIKGHTDVLEDVTVQRPRSLQAIKQSAGHIESAIEEVGFLVRADIDETTVLEPIALGELLEPAIERVRAEYPEASIELDPPADDCIVSANNHLVTLFEELITNGIEHNDKTTPHVSIAASEADGHAVVTITDDGPGLPAPQQALLTDRQLPEYDDPNTGFGLAIVRLLVEYCDGWIDVETTDTAAEGTTGTTISVGLPMTDPDASVTTERRRLGLAPVELRNVTVAALIAGIVMGVVLQSLTGAIPVIGALYGVTSLIVGWVTHLFHSIVFGLLFAVGLTRPTLRDRIRTPLELTLAGVVFGIILWFFAASLVMPTWLRAVGIPAMLPSLDLLNLSGHLVWGAVLGSLYGFLPEQPVVELLGIRQN